MYAVFGNAVHTMELLLKNNANVMMESPLLLKLKNYIIVALVNN